MVDDNGRFSCEVGCKLSGERSDSKAIMLLQQGHKALLQTLYTNC